MNNNKKKILINIGKIKSIEFLPLIIAYIIMVLFFSLTSEFFFSFSNFMNIALYTAIMGMLSCTTMLVIASGMIDFSVGSVIALGSCVIGIMMRDGYNVWLAILACLAISVIVGVCNGAMIAYVGINPFIATLATMQMFRGFAYLLTDAKSITVADPVLKFMGRDYTIGVPNVVWLLIILVVLFAWIARSTSFGRKVFVIGGNPKVAYLSGINVRKTKVYLFAIHGLITGIATILYTAQLGAALPSAAQNINFQAISAVVLGGVSLTGGKGSIVGGIVGALLLGTLNNGMVMLDIDTFWQDVIIGFVLIFAVTLDIIKNKDTRTSY